MIHQIYIESRDRIACHRLDGQDRFVIEIEADRDGVPWRLLGPMGRLEDLRDAIDRVLVDRVDILPGPPDRCPCGRLMLRVGDGWRCIECGNYEDLAPVPAEAVTASS